MYSLTIIRLNKNGMIFQNTETHDIMELGSVVSTLLGINADDNASIIGEQVNTIQPHGRKIIQLENNKLNMVWFCYITRFK